MRQFRLSTLMLLIAIAALSVALIMQQQRAARREAELRAGQAELRAGLEVQNYRHRLMVSARNAALISARKAALKSVERRAAGEKAGVKEGEGK
jgi:uncharacterized protein HemX